MESNDDKIKACVGVLSPHWYYFRMLDELWGDAAVVNHSFDLEKWLPQDADILYAQGVGQDPIDVGVQIIRNCDACRKHYQRIWAAADVVALGAWKKGDTKEILVAAMVLGADGAPRVRVVPQGSPGNLDCLDGDPQGKVFIVHDRQKRTSAFVKRSGKEDLW